MIIKNKSNLQARVLKNKMQKNKELNQMMKIIQK